jgi:hypothetical protein
MKTIMEKRWCEYSNSGTDPFTFLRAQPTRRADPLARLFDGRFLLGLLRRFAAGDFPSKRN